MKSTIYSLLITFSILGTGAAILTNVKMRVTTPTTPVLEEVTNVDSTIKVAKLKSDKVSSNIWIDIIELERQKELKSIEQFEGPDGRLGKQTDDLYQELKKQIAIELKKKQN